MTHFSALCCCCFFLSIKRLPDSPQSFFGRVERTALCRWSGEQSSSGTWRRKWQSFAWSKRLRRASVRSALSRQTWYVRIIWESHYPERVAPLLCLCIAFSRFILRHVFWITACQSVLLGMRLVWSAGNSHLVQNAPKRSTNVRRGKARLPFTKRLRKICFESKWNTTLWSFQRKISESNGTSGKVVLFYRTNCSKRKFLFHFFKAILRFSQ